MKGMYSKKPFTLVEIVFGGVMITVLLAATASVMTEQEARKHVAQTVSGMKSIGVGIKAYMVDWVQIPMDHEYKGTASGGGLDFKSVWLMVYGARDTEFTGRCLTTPVAYMKSVPVDYFNTHMKPLTHLGTTYPGLKKCFVVGWSPAGLSDYSGRDHWVKGKRKNNQSFFDFFGTSDFHALMESAGPDLAWWVVQSPDEQDVNTFLYDPTNGTFSSGQIVYLDSIGMIAPKR